MNNKTMYAIAMVAGIASAMLIIVLVMNGQNNMEHAGVYSQTSYEDSLTHRCNKLQEYFSYDVNLKCDKLVRALTS